MRQIEDEIELSLDAETVFQTLIKPSEITAWWQAKTAIVLPQVGGFWAANWGDDIDQPDYTMIARIALFDPPNRMTWTDFHYYSKNGPMPFDADFQTEFRIEKTIGAVKLCVTQSGFPDDGAADEYYQGCVTGWRNTLSAMDEFLIGNFGIDPTD